MNHLFIPSQGVGEVGVDLSNMYWFMHDSSFYNIKKEIPFFKLLLDLGSLCVRCHIQQLNVQQTNVHHRNVIADLKKKCTLLLQSFMKI